MSPLAKLQLVGPVLLLAAATAAEATGLALERMPDSASLWFLHLGVFAPLRQGDALIADAMVIAHGAGGASQQALGSSVMGGMIAVVILALLMVPVFFVSVQRVLAGDREKAVKPQAAEVHGPSAPAQPSH